MTAKTVGIDFLGSGVSRVTGFAFQFFVLTSKREVGFSVMIKLRAIPTFGRMTILALLAMGLIVYIVLTMAAVTLTGFSAVFRNPVIERMTVVAGLIEMLAVEFVLGIPIVVEDRLVPAFLLVAGLTVIAEPFGMNIPDRMAIYTPCGGIFIFALQVTGIAGYLLMQKLQFEVCFIMIKLGFTPGVRVMAIGTFFTQLAVVRIVFGMTVVAGMFCFSILAVFFMAAATVG